MACGSRSKLFRKYSALMDSNSLPQCRWLSSEYAHQRQWSRFESKFSSKRLESRSKSPSIQPNSKRRPWSISSKLKNLNLSFTFTLGSLALFTRGKKARTHQKSLQEILVIPSTKTLAIQLLEVSDNTDGLNTKYPLFALKKKTISISTWCGQILNPA